MSSQGISKLFGAEWRELFGDVKGWVTNTRIRPAYVVRQAVKWGLILTLGSIWLSFAWDRDPVLASVTFGVLIAGFMFYLVVDEIAGALFEDDPVLLRESDTAS